MKNSTIITEEYLRYTFFYFLCDNYRFTTISKCSKHSPLNSYVITHAENKWVLDFMFDSLNGKPISVSVKPGTGNAGGALLAGDAVSVESIIPILKLGGGCEATSQKKFEDYYDNVL